MKDTSATKKTGPAGSAAPPLEEQVRSALAWLQSHATKATLEGMARYAILRTMPTATDATAR